MGGIGFSKEFENVQSHSIDCLPHHGHFYQMREGEGRWEGSNLFGGKLLIGSIVCRELNIHSLITKMNDAFNSSEIPQPTETYRPVPQSSMQSLEHSIRLTWQRDTLMHAVLPRHERRLQTIILRRRRRTLLWPMGRAGHLNWHSRRCLMCV